MNAHHCRDVSMRSYRQQQVPFWLLGINEVGAVHEEEQQRLKAGMQVLAGT